MKKKIISLLVLFTVFLSSFSFCYSMAAAVQLNDIEGHWAYADIKRATDSGYIKGYTDSTFRPNRTVTRAEYITMLNSVFAVPMEGTDAGFKDVKASDWYAKGVWSAIKAGYADIFRADTIKPNQPLTRQEAATLTANLSGITSSEENKSFIDSNQIEAWAKKQVSAMAEAGIIGGYLDESFRPTGNITRAEAVSIINRTKIYTESTKLDTSIKVTGSIVNIRSGPDTSYGVVTKVSAGKILNAQLLSSNNWYKVNFDGMSGWIIGDYADKNYAADNSGNPSRGGDVDRGGGEDEGRDEGRDEEKGGSENNSEDSGSNDPGKVEDTEAGDDKNSSDDKDNAGSDEVTYPGYQLGDKTGKKLVVVDAGHGGHDPGAVGFEGTREKDINLSIAFKLAVCLSEAGYNVIMTRFDDTFIPLKERSAIANNANADLFISIHCNASEKHDAVGTSVYTQSESPAGVYPNQEDSRRLASYVQEELLSALGLKNAGVRRKNLSVCRETNAPTVLVEVAFLDNLVEEVLLNIPEFQQQAALAIKKGVDSYFADGEVRID